MMKRKVIALLAIATMLLGTVPVSASPLVSSQGQEEVTGTGTVIDYDRTPKYQVTLPTNKAFDFTIDPNGLLNLTSGGATAAKTATGTVEIGVASSAAAVIKNESNVPIIVNTKFTVSNTGKAKLVTGKNLLTNTAGEATDAAIFLKIVPAKAKTVMTTAPALASDYALVLTGNNQMSFKLNAADYVVERHGNDANATFSVRLATSAANYDATVLKLQGDVNKADWTEYSKTTSPAAIGLTAVFSYKPCTTDVELVDPTDTNVHGLISGQAVSTIAVAGDYYAGYGNTYIPTDTIEGTITKVTVNGTQVAFDLSSAPGNVFLTSVTSASDEVLIYAGDKVYEATITVK